MKISVGTSANKCCIISENYVVISLLSHLAVQTEVTIWISEIARGNVKQFTISIGATVSGHFVCLVETRRPQWFSKCEAQVGNELISPEILFIYF
jgi:hypothetical protein